MVLFICVCLSVTVCVFLGYLVILSDVLNELRISLIFSIVSMVVLGNRFILVVMVTTLNLTMVVAPGNKHDLNFGCCP